MMGPPYGKRDPYYSHTTPIFESLKIWVPWYGSRLPFSGVPCPWGSLKFPEEKLADGSLRELLKVDDL